MSGIFFKVGVIRCARDVCGEKGCWGGVRTGSEWRNKMKG